MICQRLRTSASPLHVHPDATGSSLPSNGAGLPMSRCRLDGGSVTRPEHTTLSSLPTKRPVCRPTHSRRLRWVLRILGLMHAVRAAIAMCRPEPISQVIEDELRIHHPEHRGRPVTDVRGHRRRIDSLVAWGARTRYSMVLMAVPVQAGSAGSVVRCSCGSSAASVIEARSIRRAR